MDCVVLCCKQETSYEMRSSDWSSDVCSSDLNWDTDMKQSDIIHLFPESPILKIHKYQHIYMWFIYPFYTLNWLFNRDFKDFFGTKDNYLKRILRIDRKRVV